MDDVEEILWHHDISCYPDINDLTEEQARKVLNILTENGDCELPSGEDCKV